MGLKVIPSTATLPQRLDAHAEPFSGAVLSVSMASLKRVGAVVTPPANGLVALDADGTPFDNRGPSKEGVSRTYKGSDGCAPMAASLGEEGCCLGLEPRVGTPG